MFFRTIPVRNSKSLQIVHYKMIQKIDEKSLTKNLNHNGGCWYTFITIKIPNFYHP